MKPYFDDGGGRIIYCADCWDVLPQLEPSSIDVILTDPPYSSGGLHLGSRQQAPTDKYISAGHWSNKKDYPDYMGDSCDQWTWMLNARTWLMECYRLTKEGGHLYLFTDWRQIAVAITVLQMASWQYRGVVVWDKGNTARAPYPGAWRHGAEFLLWGSKGSPWTCTEGKWEKGIAPVHNVLAVDGCRDKQHITEKPVELVKKAITVGCPPDGIILDPFAGSGTTIRAAKDLGRRAIGVEIVSVYAEIAARRLSQEAMVLEC